MPVVATLGEMAELAGKHPGMFVRWSRGPAADAAGASADDLTGEPLSWASPLKLRARRLPAGYLAAFFAGVAGLVAAPYTEELARCARNRGQRG